MWHDYVHESTTFSPLSLSAQRRDLRVPALGLNLWMHIQDTNVLNPGRIIRRRVGRYASGLEDRTREREKNRESGEFAGVYKDELFYYFSYRQGRKRGKKRRARWENNEGTGWRGAEGGRGGGGEGLTAINFAKIGAYAVAGRQSNPSSAHHPPLSPLT